MLPFQALLHKLVSVLLPGSEGVLLKLKSHVDHQRILFFIFWGALKSSRDFWGVNIHNNLEINGIAASGYVHSVVLYYQMRNDKYNEKTINKIHLSFWGMLYHLITENY